jgi:hypothetical protein
MPRRVEHKQSRASRAREDKATKLRRKEAELSGALAKVRAMIGAQEAPRSSIMQHTPSSSSITTVRIQPGSQSVIPLHGASDHSHQITLSFREPEGSGRTPAQNTSSLPIYTCVVHRCIAGRIQRDCREFDISIPPSHEFFMISCLGYGAYCIDVCPSTRKRCVHSDCPD